MGGDFNVRSGSLSTHGKPCIAIWDLSLQFQRMYCQQVTPGSINYRRLNLS